MEDMLRSHVVSKQTIWEERLPFIEFIYNNSRHASTGMTPFRAMYGYDPLIPLDLDLKNFKGKTQVSLEMLEEMNNELKECKRNIERAQARAELYEDKKRSPRNFKVGDMIYLRVKPNSSLSTGRCAKLSPRYCGPFIILEKVNEAAYRLELPSHVKMHTVFHVRFLKKALSRFENSLLGYIDVQEVE